MAVKNDATVLAFEKKLVPSDGYLYGTTWNDRSKVKPLTLTPKSVRGTISNRLKPALQNDPLKLNAEVEKPNLQTVDACALAEDQDTLKLSFTLKVLGGIDKPSASNGPEFNKSYHGVAQNYVAETGFTELAKRYAINIANGRYLWRNRVGAEKVEVVVSLNEGETLSFDAKQFSLRDFNADSPDLQKLAGKIAAALSGNLPYLLIRVEAYALVGSAQEVYPSEELVLDKGKGNKSKILYAVNGTAALHSQKIGNAIRTIDTWYPAFAEAGIGPIAIEPYGSVTNLGKAFRTPKDKADFYSLFDRFALGETLASKDQEHYVMAVLVRGGVFGQSGKEKE
ncbi:type I-F CRISPR-associated protein Csy3 [Methylomonas methanica]|uniref:CRISPR-associated protein, Csy3 family n=1 Tax=Methylomonas methanica (strain DSM 25384 / MC09) TaxID=857087 RepID=F9ZYW7_METMM|nr:type I-F CRISPR-associated protein Csy3 [Methylomonas methanica]AEF99822.1 CRISPR-associated protein, Csy3 family [Methylomonas methanica MC09]